MHQVFRNLPGVQVVSDDIPVWGCTKKEHDKRLPKAMQSKFFKKEVRHLEFMQSRVGITVDTDTLEDIIALAPP